MPVPTTSPHSRCPAGSDGFQSASPPARSRSPLRWPSPAPGDQCPEVDVASVREALTDLAQTLQAARRERVRGWGGHARGTLAVTQHSGLLRPWRGPSAHTAPWWV